MAANAAFLVIAILEHLQSSISRYDLLFELFLELLLSVALCVVAFLENQKHMITFKKVITLLAAYIPVIIILLNIKTVWAFTADTIDNMSYRDSFRFLDYWDMLIPFILATVKQIGFICISAILAHNTYNEKYGKLNKVGSIGFVTLPVGIGLGFLIALISYVIDDEVYFFNGSFITGVLWVIVISLVVISALLLPLAILYPAKPRIVANNGINMNGVAEDGYISLGKHIVLCLFTFGIWNWIWIYRTTAYLNRTPNAEQYNPTSKLLLFIFVPFYSIYWYCKHGGRIDSLSRSRNMNQSDMATMCLILGIFIPIVARVLMQDRINSLCTATNTSNSFSSPQQEEKKLENIKQLKELLDSGVITQEEFEAKKKQLLGL